MDKILNNVVLTGEDLKYLGVIQIRGYPLSEMIFVIILEACGLGNFGHPCANTLEEYNDTCLNVRHSSTDGQYM